MGETPRSTLSFFELGIDSADLFRPAALLGSEADPYDYKYYEHSVLALGSTFSPNDVCAPKLSCLNFTPEQLDPGPTWTGFTASYVRSLEELHLSIGLDVKASASYLAAKADVHYNFQLSSSFSSQTIIVSINARTDYGRWGLKAGTTLDPTVTKLLQDPKRFSEKCGTRYVNMEYRAAAVSAVVVIENVSQETKASFDAEFSGQGGSGPLSASASSKFNSELKHASKQDRVNIHVGATGGPGFSKLKGIAEGLLGGDQQVAKIGAALSEYIGEFGPGNAASVAFKVRPLSDFGYDESQIDPWLDIHERYLRLLAKEYRLTTEAIDIDQSIVDGTSPLSKLLPAVILGSVKYELPLLTKYQIDLADCHHRFKDAAGTQTPGDLPSTRVVSSALKGLELKPRVQFWAVGLNDNQLRVVLNATPSQRLVIARQFNPAIQQLAVTWGARGFKIFTIQIYFIDESGKEWNISNETPDAGDGARVWSADGLSGTEEVLRKWAFDWDGDHSGTFGLKIKDAGQTVHRYGIMEASWEAKELSFNYRTNMII